MDVPQDQAVHSKRPASSTSSPQSPPCASPIPSRPLSIVSKMTGQTKTRELTIGIDKTTPKIVCLWRSEVQGETASERLSIFRDGRKGRDNHASVVCLDQARMDGEDSNIWLLWLVVRFLYRNASIASSQHTKVNVLSQLDLGKLSRRIRTATWNQ